MEVHILPLAITMMAGPQILTSVMFAISKNSLKNSASYTSAIFLAVITGILVSFLIADILPSSLLQNESNQQSDAAKYLQLGLLALLAGMTVRTYLNRTTVKLPKWLGTIQSADSKKAFKLGWMLIFLMPADLIIMLSAGLYIKSNDLSLISSVAFALLTALISAFPFFAFKVLGKKMNDSQDINKWLNANAWLVNIFVYMLFAYLIIS